MVWKRRTLELDPMKPQGVQERRQRLHDHEDPQRGACKDEKRCGQEAPSQSETSSKHGHDLFVLVPTDI